jgi:HTH-type transcriptional regulator, sugar sensing transcriptional regulator
MPQPPVLQIGRFICVFIVTFMVEFTELGLSTNEQKVYVVLLQHGKLSASLASRHSGVSYGKIYEVLASLEHKGFVSVVPEKTKLYVPANPSQLLDKIEEKEQKLAQLRSKVDELKQQYDENQEEAVTVIRGKNNFLKFLKQQKKTPKTFSYIIKHDSIFVPQIIRSVRKTRSKGVDIRIMSGISSEYAQNIKDWREKEGVITRFIKNDGGVISVNDFEVMIILTRKNTLMLIRDSNFVQLMRQLLGSFYNDAPEIDDNMLSKYLPF